MTRSSLKGHLVRFAITTLAVFIASGVIPGIRYDDWSTLLAAALTLALATAIVRPILVLFTLPFVLLTLGLGLLVINALLLMLVGQLVPSFEVAGFWSAFFGSLVISIFNSVAGLWIGPADASRPRMVFRSGSISRTPDRHPSARAKDDVIDI